MAVEMTDSGLPVRMTSEICLSDAVKLAHSSFASLETLVFTSSVARASMKSRCMSFAWSKAAA